MRNSPPFFPYGKNPLLLKRLWLCWALFGGFFMGGFSTGFAQVGMDVDAIFTPSAYTISVDQNVRYTNLSRDTLTQFYFNDWINAFSRKISPLGKHFSAIYVKRFHYSDLSERGFTKLEFIKNAAGEKLYWNRPDGHPDILRLKLNAPLAPGDTVVFHLSYLLRIPEDKFTGYGRDEHQHYK